MNFMKDRIEKGIKEFNNLRAPEANASLISFRGKILKVKFTGPFCLGCGIYDYFEDLKVFLEEQKVKTKIESVREIEDGFIVKFKVIE